MTDTRDFRLGVWAALVAVALAVVVLIGLIATEPVSKSPTGVVRVFSFTFDPDGPSGTPAFYAFEPGALCPPSGATGDGLLAFAWSDLSGDNVTSFFVTVPGAVPPPQSFVTLYHAANSSQGGYGLFFGYPLCEYSVVFSGVVPSPQLLSVQGAYVYNATGLGLNV